MLAYADALFGIAWGQYFYIEESDRRTVWEKVVSSDEQFLSIREQFTGVRMRKVYDIM